MLGLLPFELFSYFSIIAFTQVGLSSFDVDWEQLGKIMKTNVRKNRMYFIFASLSFQ
jgi:hypothetical protein